ncbi:MAG TPA: hypothetical protein VMR50_13150 [Myxococcota bacterium]|nr:hypothetical protein [Myxococcota bacterium]
MSTMRIACCIAVLGGLAWLAAPARAQDSAGWHDAGAGASSWKKADTTWYEVYIKPSMKKFDNFEESPEQPFAIYEPQVKPLHPPPPDRRAYKYQPDSGKLRPTIVAGDLPPNRGDYVDARDWNDISERANPMRPEMFRFYLDSPSANPAVGAH